MTARGLAVPTTLPTVDRAPFFATPAADCAASAQAERDNIAFYDRWLATDLPDDVRLVFESNRRASLMLHLPAFERCQ